MQDLKKQSPYGAYVEHCRKGELAYQVTPDGKPVFFPRVVAPGSGAGLEWRVSAGVGTVHATTVVHYRDEPPLNVALIDLDEGFRMMSRVEGIDPTQVQVGMRVKVKMLPGDGKQPPYPVFTPLLPEEGSARSAGGGPPLLPEEGSARSAGGGRKAQPTRSLRDHPSSGRKGG